MGVQRIDTIGIINFVIYIPITLLGCFAILRIDKFLKYLKNIISYAEEYKVYYIILLITILLIFVSLMFYVNGYNDLQYSYQVGERLQEECQKIYSIYNSANYQFKLNIEDTNSMSSIRKMHLACLSLYIIIGLVFTSIFLDNLLIYTKDNQLSMLMKVYLCYPLLGIGGVILVMITIFKSLNVPTYLQTNTVPLSLIYIYVFMVLCYIYQYFKMGSKMQPYSIILLATSLFAIGLIYITQTNNLVDSIKIDYFNLTDIAGKNPNANAKTIAFDLETIAKQNALDNNVKPLESFKKYSDLPYPPNTPLTKYVMNNIKAIPKWNFTVPPDSEPLWPYVLNEVNGKELESFYITGSDQQKENILQFRKDMAILRSFHEPGERLRSFSMIINFIIFGLIITVLYPIFNMMYVNDSLLVTYIVAITVILVLGICCIIGFISKILP